MPARSPRRLAALVASDLGTAIAAKPDLDVENYLHEQFGQVLQTFVVIMRDGQILSNHDDVPAAAARSGPRRTRVHGVDRTAAIRAARRLGRWPRIGRSFDATFAP
jgi:hypothetical protein